MQRLRKCSIILVFLIGVISTDLFSADLNPHINDCGDKSLRECHDRTALIIIDMQPYFAERNGAYEDRENMIKINKIMEQQKKSIQMAREAGMPIVMIEYDCGPCDPTSKSLMRAVEGYNDVKVIKKTSDGMFDSWNSNREDLMHHLDSRGVDNLIITGANGGACVEASISGALRQDYDVFALEPGIADFNYREFIYPYSYEESGSFRQERESCTNCSFQEFDNIESLGLALMREGSGARFSSAENQDNRGTPVEKNRIGQSYEYNSSGGQINTSDAN